MSSKKTKDEKFQALIDNIIELSKEFGWIVVALGSPKSGLKGLVISDAKITAKISEVVAQQIKNEEATKND